MELNFELKTKSADNARSQKDQQIQNVQKGLKLELSRTNQLAIDIFLPKAAINFCIKNPDVSKIIY